MSAVSEYVSPNHHIYLVSLRNIDTVVAFDKESSAISWTLSSSLDSSTFSFIHDEDKFYDPHDAQVDPSQPTFCPRPSAFIQEPTLLPRKQWRRTGDYGSRAGPAGDVVWFPPVWSVCGPGGRMVSVRRRRQTD